MWPAACNGHVPPRSASISVSERCDPTSSCVVSCCAACRPGPPSGQQQPQQQSKILTSCGVQWDGLIQSFAPPDAKNKKNRLEAYPYIEDELMSGLSSRSTQSTSEKEK